MIHRRSVQGRLASPVSFTFTFIFMLGCVSCSSCVYQPFRKRFHSYERNLRGKSHASSLKNFIKHNYSNQIPNNHPPPHLVIMARIIPSMMYIYIFSD